MAVFTPVSLDEARSFLSAYDIGQLLHLEGIEEGVSNTNFKVETTSGLYALTLFESATDESALPYFMDYTLHLDQKGYPAPGPAVMKNGDTIGTLNGRKAALIKWLPGRWPRNPDVRHAASAGEYLAKLHKAGADFTQVRENTMGVNYWDELIARCEPKASQSPRAEAILEDFRSEVSWLKSVWVQDLPAGAIHADYFTDNVLMNDDGQVTGVIDYYYACTDSYAYDLAVSLNAWGFTPGGQPLPEMISAFVSAYDAERPLSEAEIAALPLMARGSAVRFTLTRLYDLLNHDPSWVVKPKDPEAFYRRLEYHRGIETGRDYF
ncbi:MAG: homoserine kinase [Asticcacaulis sp.]